MPIGAWKKVYTMNKVVNFEALDSIDERLEHNQHSNIFSPLMKIGIIGENKTPARYRDLTNIYNTCSFALSHGNA